jgi:L-lactate dehydrogenase
MAMNMDSRVGAGGNKVAIIGAGKVGSSCAFALAHAGSASEIVLIDMMKELAEGEAMDISHGIAYLSPATIRTGEYAECQDADVIVITAGTGRKPGETRMDLLQRNTGIMRGVLDSIPEHKPDAVIVMVANPVDVMGYAAIKLSDFAPQRVIATGTILETARLRYMVGQHCNVAPSSVEGYTLGEHGESQVTTWSQVRIAGVAVAEYCKAMGIDWSSETEADIAGRVKSGGADVIKRKGATFYGIAACTSRIVTAILRDEHTVLPVSTLAQGAYGIEGVYISLPTVVGRAGSLGTFTPALSDTEVEAMRKSAEVLRGALQETGLG